MLEPLGPQDRREYRAPRDLVDFKDFLEEHKDEIKALSIYYSQPYRRRDVTYQMIKEVFDLVVAQKWPRTMLARKNYRK